MGGVGRPARGIRFTVVCFLSQVDSTFRIETSFTGRRHPAPGAGRGGFAFSPGYRLNSALRSADQRIPPRRRTGTT